MTLGLYIPGNSWLHRLPVALKLLSLAIAGMGLFFVSNWIGFLPPLLGVGILLASVHTSWRMLWRHLRPLLWLFIAIGLLHALLNDWHVGLVIVLRFLVLILGAILITVTTPVSAMVDAIERGLQPLKPLGIRPAQISLMIALSLRLIPVILEQIQAVQEAQRARGIEKPAIALFVPVLIRVLQLSENLVDALDARGYDAEDA